MSILAGSLNQIATYWAPTSTKDRYGQLVLSAPVRIKVRWEDRSELFIDPDGNEARSVARIYCDRNLQEGGWLYLGSSNISTPGSVSGAKVIRQVRRSPSISNDEFVYRAVL